MSAPSFRLLSADDLRTLPPPAWLIDGLVPASGLSVLYGPSGAGKSFLALDWALSVATGLPSLGRCVEPGWVVFVAAEGRSGLGLRYDAWSESRGHPDANRIRFLPEAVNLLDRVQVERLRRTLATLPERPRLLVVDTMARTMVGGDENSAKDVGAFIAAVDGLRLADAALVVHHSGKDGRAGARGSSALWAGADLMARLERDGRSPRLVLRCEKLKDGAAEWEAVPLCLEATAGSCVLSLRAKRQESGQDLQATVLAVVADRGPISGNGVAAVVRKRKEDVQSALKALEQSGQLRQTPKGYVLGPGAAEPDRNRGPAALTGTGSREGQTPVGGPPGGIAPRAEAEPQAEPGLGDDEEPDA